MCGGDGWRCESNAGWMIAGAVVVVVVEEVGDECFEVVRGQSGGLVQNYGCVAIMVCGCAFPMTLMSSLSTSLQHGWVLVRGVVLVGEGCIDTHHM